MPCQASNDRTTEGATEMTQQIKIGDRITFRAATRGGKPQATRKVVGFWVDGRPEVRFHGWPRFIVRWEEIVAVDAA